MGRLDVLPTHYQQGHMTMTASSDRTATLDGLSVDQAVDIVVDETDDPDTVRETLGIVAQDGVVCRAGVDDALANASKVVMTAETRVEFAQNELDDIREVAASVPEFDLVSTRLSEFTDRLDAIETQADELGDAVQDVLDLKAEGELYAAAQRIRQLTTAATEVQRAADDFQFELDSVESWFTDADRRAEELAADVDAVAESMSELDGVVDSIERDDEGSESADGGSESDDRGSESDDGGSERDDGGSDSEAAHTWAAATVRHRVVSLLLADLRAELSTLRTWAERVDEAPPSGIESRIDDLQASHEALGERLDTCAEPAWSTRFDEQLAALDEELAGIEPPVSWLDVEAIVEEYRPVAE